MTRQKGWKKAIKRGVDVAAVALASPIATPLALGTALLVRFSMGEPVIFAQDRPGYHGEIFKAYKFRTMKNAVDEKGNSLPDEMRLTSIGKLIRKLSLDELPQLLNVLKGDMSLVGPRPLLVEYLERYSDEQFRRHDVLPGITGWAQVCGRNATSWQERFEQDLYYVDHWSLVFDAKILIKTIEKVIKRDGISQAGEATMRVFMGNDEEGKPR